MKLFGMELFRKNMDEEELIEILNTMTRNKKLLIERASEIQDYCKKTFNTFIPFGINEYGYNNVIDVFIEDESLVALEYTSNSDYYNYKRASKIPLSVIISNDWKRMCLEEHLRLKNKYEIEKIKNEKLMEARKKKEEIELFIKLKEKYGVDVNSK